MFKALPSGSVFVPAAVKIAQISSKAKILKFIFDILDIFNGCLICVLFFRYKKR